MIQCAGFDGGPFDERSVDGHGMRFIRAFVKLVFSGSYVANGDALDLTNNNGANPLFPSTLIAACAAAGGVADLDVIVRSPASGVGNNGGSYELVAPNSNAPLKFADLANLKVRIWKNSAGSVTEYSAGAYSTDVTNDVVILEVVFPR